MKVIGILPFKNEEHFLPTYLSNVKPICDEIIAVDDYSTDNSRKIMEDAGVIVKGYEDTNKKPLVLAMIPKSSNSFGE